jgi:hypothetical protein
MRQTADRRWFAGRAAGEVLQRRLPDSGAPRAAPDGIETATQRVD